MIKQKSNVENKPDRKNKHSIKKEDINYEKTKPELFTGT